MDATVQCAVLLSRIVLFTVVALQLEERCSGGGHLLHDGSQCVYNARHLVAERVINVSSSPYDKIHRQ